MNRISFFFSPILLIFFGILSGTALSSPQKIKFSDIRFQPLKGISKLWILIEELSEDETNIDLTEERIRTITEVKLRREGILASEEDIKENWALTCLYVNINVVGFAFNVSIEIKEFVALRREKSIECTAVTWDRSITGTHGKDPDYIISSLSESLDIFVNDCYKANPKK